MIGFARRQVAAGARRTATAVASGRGVTFAATRSLTGSRLAPAAVTQCSTRQPLPCQRVGRRRFSTEGVLQIKTPEFGAESITEGSLQEWNKKVGEFVREGDVIAVIETDKVSIEVKAEKSGILQEILANVDDTVEVGQPLATLKPGSEPPAGAKAPEAPEAPKPAAPAAAEPAAPAQAKKEAAAPAAAAAPSSGGSEVSAPVRAERRVKMTRMRQSISRSMKEAQNTACMLTTFQEVDMSALIQLRKSFKDEFEAVHGIRLGFMGAFVKASTYGLSQIPSINAVIDDAKQEIVYRDYCDISVAVASPKGLVVPVIRNAQSLAVHEVEGAIGQLALLARNDELGMEDMMGGTFTITNGGVFGSLLSTPILNCGFGPQSAILGMHFTKDRPVVLKNGEIVPRPIMQIALTYDHRLIDGREAVTFLCMVRDQIEDPRRLLLQC